MQAHLQHELDEIRAAGLYKTERVICSPQRAAIEVAGREVRSSKAIEGLFADFRKVVPFVDDDTLMYPLIAKAVKFLQEN